MGPENLIIQFLITAESLNPYTARAIAIDRTQGPVSLNKPLKTREGDISELTLKDIISDDKSVEDIAEANIIKQKLKQLVDSSNLTLSQRLAFDLRVFQDWFPGEIAKVMNLRKPQNAQNLIARSWQKIRKNPDYEAFVKFCEFKTA